MGSCPLPQATSEDGRARLAIVLLLLLTLLTGCGADQSGPATTSSTSTANPAGEPPLIAASGGAIARVSLTELPDEALETIALIQAGGPFPFERDGISFGNYEGNLPRGPLGYYREYTVITPGLDHRGARRIVAGNEGAALYYTDDHYQSFVEVILPDD